MRELWNDFENRYVYVPDRFTMVITLDIPHEVVYDRDHPIKSHYPYKEGLKEAEFKMSRVEVDYDSKEALDNAYESVLKKIERRDNPFVRIGRRMLMLDHIVMIEKVVE